MDIRGGCAGLIDVGGGSEARGGYGFGGGNDFDVDAGAEGLEMRYYELLVAGDGTWVEVVSTDQAKPVDRSNTHLNSAARGRTARDRMRSRWPPCLCRARSRSIGSDLAGMFACCCRV